MFDIGFTEILLIGVVALVVLGPEKLPIAVRTLGMWIGKAKRTIGGIQSEISEELRLDELKRTVSVAKEQLNSELDDMKAPFVDESAETKKETVEQAVSSSAEGAVSPENIATDQSKNPSQ